MARSWTPDQWSRVAELYDAAAVLPPGDRSAFLAGACPGDAALVAEVESLLAQEEVASLIDGTLWVPGDLLRPPSLDVGARLGGYVIEGLAGTGGMGEVYRARDTRLGRSVALKVLSGEFASDPERQSRLEREARVLAALNNPYIAAVYGIENHDGTRAIALEFVDGPTLAEVLARGPMALATAVATARQIADALSAAHEVGIVHRDLKPANIKVTPDGFVKLLDFGLARMVADEEERTAAAANQASAGPLLTTAGAVMGTAAYMSPEQATGGTTDTRTDVWAFGCVLYEMLTGRRAFSGDTFESTVDAVLHAEPDWQRLPGQTPAVIRRLLERCLRKERKQRLAAVADARWHFDDAVEAVPQAGRPVRYAWLAAGTSLLVAMLAIAFVVWNGRAARRPDAAVRFTVAAPGGVSFEATPGGGTGTATQLAISPDGRHLVFVGRQDGVFRLWLRALDGFDSLPLPGTDGASFPFWSPDSKTVAFFADEQLKKIALDGTAPTVICQVSGGRGGSWSRDNVILFASLGTNLQRVSGTGGTPAPVSSDDPRGEGSRWPFFLPDGRHFLYTEVLGPCCPTTQPSVLKIGSLAGGETARVLLHAESAAGFASGHVYFGRDGTLFAQPFDAERLTLAGEPVQVAERVGWEGSRYLSASMSMAGHLAYAEGGAPPLHQMTWYDRGGTVLGTLGPPTTWNTLALSPDDQHVAVSMPGGSPPNLDIYVFHTPTGNATRLTSNDGADSAPVWSPDGARIAYEREAGDVFSLRQVSLDGSRDEALSSDGGRYLATSWSRDGRFIAFARPALSGGYDVWLLPLSGARRPHPVVDSPARETSGAISPDGRWLAFTSFEAGRPQVFIQPFPGGGGRRQVSSEPGSHPVWRRDGRELLYIAFDARDRSPTGAGGSSLMSVSIDAAGQAVAHRELFRAAFPRFSDGQVFAVTSDGQRILGSVRVAPQLPLGPLHVVVNWQSASGVRGALIE